MKGHKEVKTKTAFPAKPVIVENAAIADASWETMQSQGAYVHIYYNFGGLWYCGTAWVRYTREKVTWRLVEQTCTHAARSRAVFCARSHKLNSQYACTPGRRVPTQYSRSTHEQCTNAPAACSPQQQVVSHAPPEHSYTRRLLLLT